MPLRSVVIVGASLAGGRAAEELRKKGFDGSITLIGEESYRPYERPPLSKEFLRGEKPLDKAFLRPEEWYAENQVELMLGARAERLDLNERVVEIAGGARISYDALLLTTGGRPRQLDLPGSTLGGIFTLRTARDSEAIREHLKRGGRVVVIGAGFIGSEVAASARMLGCDVTIIEVFAVPLERVLGADLGAVLARVHSDKGTKLLMGSGVERFEGNGTVQRVVTSGGTALEADVVIVGVGMIPNVELAQEAGIAVENGILVDELCRTSVPGVYAAGDVANHPNPILGERIRVEHWQNAQNQGGAAARAILGDEEPFAEVPWFFSDQYDVEVQMAGHPTHYDRLVFRGDVDGLSFSAFFLDGKQLRGVFGLNRNKDVRGGRALIEAGKQVDDDVLADESVDLRALAKQP